MRDLDRAISRLSEEQRQVILLVGLEGMRYEQAAQILDIPGGTERSRLSRVRDELRALMQIDEENTSALVRRAATSRMQHAS